MQVSGVGTGHIADLVGKSKEVPQGLQRRELELPPGIAKKLDAGGTLPAGILKRFPAAAPAPLVSPQPDQAVGEPSQTLDIVV